MTDAGHANPTHHHARLPRPIVRLLAAAAGALAGLLLALLLPVAAAPESAAHGPAGAAALRVFEIVPGGAVYERRAGAPPSLLPPDAVISHDLPTAPAAPAAHAAPDLIPGEHSAAALAEHRPGVAHAGPPPGGVSPLLIIPFALMLLSIALMPFISERTWADHYPAFAFALGACTLVYYLAALGAYGREQMLHVALEYYAFIALVGGLFVTSGGILIDVRGRATPAVNTAMLAAGTVLANLVGTTGASVLLIRPFMRLNRGRLRPVHVVFFIFIVSNCAGCLTPIGDPPLYLGFLRGVDFFWTIGNLWPMWLTCNAALLALFFVIDSRLGAAAPGPGEHAPAQAEPARTSVHIRGLAAMVALPLIVGGVFIDPVLAPRLGLVGWPLGPTFQIAVAAAAYALAPRRIHEANAFTFHPVKEVGYLFVGIFLTMAPALAYLQANGSTLGLSTPTHYYFATGSLSAFLDNAPTYLNFLQAALGTLHVEMNAADLERFTTSTYVITSAGGAGGPVAGRSLLAAISLGAVFFGAVTYIGNGPNFMVKSIAEASGHRMPSFFGYTLYSLVLLLPILVGVWLIYLA